MSNFKTKSLNRLRLYYIDELRISMTKLRNVADECLKKIDKEDRDNISGYYSGNSDIHRYVSNAWRASWALCELKRFDDEIKNEIDRVVRDIRKEEKKAKKKSWQNLF
jgi:hypothetical protein